VYRRVRRQGRFVDSAMVRRAVAALRRVRRHTDRDCGALDSFKYTSGASGREEAKVEADFGISRRRGGPLRTELRREWPRFRLLSWCDRLFGGRWGCSNERSQRGVSRPPCRAPLFRGYPYDLPVMSMSRDTPGRWVPVRNARMPAGRLPDQKSRCGNCGLCAGFASGPCSPWFRGHKRSRRSSSLRWS
jgi:hypothetical protein